MASETSMAAVERPATARVGSTLSSVVRWGVLIVLALVILIPVAYAVLSGFKDNYQISLSPMALPDPWIVSNYTTILGSESFWRQAGNSVLIALVSAFVVVAFASLAAFVFARRAFPGRELIFTLFTLGLFFPSAVAILPLFILVRTLGLLDNPLGIALPQAAFALPITIIILRPFFRSIPRELEDAAAIDGCGTFGFFWRVLLPLSRPALATVTVLAVVSSWNQFLLPLVILSDQNNWTLPLGVTNFSTQYSTDTALVLAYTSLALIPALIFYVIAERQLVGGLTTGSVKG
jgi:raffinose/stachyose/melibiose transport system permease protein